MGYNVIDLINKAITISNSKKKIYENIRQQNSDSPSMKIILTILIKQIEKTITYYETLNNELVDSDFDEIDFRIYDRISFLINEFKGRMSEPEIHDVKKFLEFSLVLEKGTYALFIDIQGRFVNKTSDVNTKTYMILTEMIKNKGKFITMLESTMT